jgi:hypothetical protein
LFARKKRKISTFEYMDGMRRAYAVEGLVTATANGLSIWQAETGPQKVAVFWLGERGASAVGWA